MDFSLTEEQLAIQAMAKTFSTEQIAPNARQWEREGTIPRDFLQRAASLGLAGIYVDEQLGGAGLTRADAALIFESLACGCPAVSAYLSIHNMCAWMIDQYGDRSQRQYWLPRLCQMQSIAAYCLTEPGSGSDAAALSTRAEVVDGGYRLNGSKSFISGAGLADVYVVMCRTGDEGAGGISTILVEKHRAGLSFGALEDKMGWRAQPTAEVRFDDCFVPQENLVGEEGQGFKYAMSGLDGGRLNIAASALGAAQAAFSLSLDYVGERRAFGRALDQFQGLQFRLAEMETRLQAARIFLYQSAWKLDNRAPDATKFCAMAKLHVTDVASAVANDALQLLGGYGYLADYGIEKIVRDLRVHQILEGTNEIMRIIISRALLAERDL